MDTTTRTRIVRLKKEAANLPARIIVLEQAMKTIEARMTTLKKAGLIYATEHWRTRPAKSDGGTGSATRRYMILVYPMKAGERPSPTYIGCDEDKIKAAQEGIARAGEYDKAARELEGLEAAIRASEYAFDELNRGLRAE
jgi:hypothetical protein